ncbi:MAG: response regulator [Alphaproteobacteria bacterium]|nr:response regulator [Alphaproteobacteria bacterium]
MSDFIHILIAEDNQVSRDLMSGILQTQGYKIHGVSDGQEAIERIRAHDIDLALVDINMAPKGGFEFVKHLVAQGIDLPVVVITGDQSSDILTEANALGVQRVLQKPVEPKRLIETVERILKRRGFNPSALAVEAREPATYSPQILMAKVIDMAIKNVSSGKGGPYGAIVTGADGKILGEGVNGRASRMDPTAHAEVMAIRQAAERLSRGDLSDCTLYCSSEPTMMGQALIASVGIKKIYYALTHDEIRHIRDRGEEAARQNMGQRESAEYTQIGRDEAMEMFKSWDKS